MEAGVEPAPRRSSLLPNGMACRDKLSALRGEGNSADERGTSESADPGEGTLPGRSKARCPA